MRYVRFIVFCYLGYFRFNLQYHSKIKSFEKTRTSKKIRSSCFVLSLNPDIKKRTLKGSFNNGGNDEARTRDLMRDRHAL